MDTTTSLLQTTIHELNTQAARDGLITQYERNIITQVEYDAKRYIIAFEQASEDGVIDKNEKISLNRLIDEMKNNAEMIALSDNILSRNEKDLLLKLKKIIKYHYL